MTASLTAPAPPSTTIRVGRNRASSVAVAAGSEPLAVRRIGPFALAAAGDPARASGKDDPVAMNAVPAPPPKRDRLIAAAVAYRSAPARRAIEVTVLGVVEDGGAGAGALQAFTKTMAE